MGPGFRILRFVFGACIVAGLLHASTLAAQQKIEAGVFLDYLGISQTSTNNFGVGGRFGYRVHPAVMLEGELAYDYGINFNEVYRNISTGDVVAIENTSVGVTHGLFGPKLQASGSGFRPFVTLKGGFLDFRLAPSFIPYSDVISAVSGIRTSRMNFAMYPAGGLEANLGPVGIRFEIGDEIYFNNGSRNNLRITFGPQLRF